jgi:hypothetical protein
MRPRRECPEAEVLERNGTVNDFDSHLRTGVQDVWSAVEKTARLIG